MTAKVKRIKRTKATQAILVVHEGFSQFNLTLWNKSHPLRKRLRNEVIFVCFFPNFIANSIGLSIDGEEQSGLPGKIVNTIGLHWLRQYPRS